MLSLQPKLRGSFDLPGTKDAAGTNYFSVSGLEDQMDLFIHHQFPDVLTRTVSVVLSSTLKCNIKH